jgi:dTDP-4-dehydrorhamnose reductase
LAPSYILTLHDPSSRLLRLCRQYLSELHDPERDRIQNPFPHQSHAARRSVFEDAVTGLKPDFVINAAGYTGKPNVDASEQQKLTCIEANLTLPGIISEVCAQHGIPWGHVSSGCIFTGAA